MYQIAEIQSPSFRNHAVKGCPPLGESHLLACFLIFPNAKASGHFRELHTFGAFAELFEHLLFVIDVENRPDDPGWLAFQLLHPPKHTAPAVGTVL